MPDTLASDILVAVIGAVVGSVLTVTIAYAIFLLQRNRNEAAALRGLISELHHKRALALISQPREIPDAAGLDDFKRASASVIDIRRRVRRTRDSVRADSPTQLALSKMTRACNVYPERTAANPRRYWFELMDLRASLAESVGAIASEVRSVKAMEPGSGAY